MPCRCVPDDEAPEHTDNDQRNRKRHDEQDRRDGHRWRPNGHRLVHEGHESGHSAEQARHCCELHDFSWRRRDEQRAEQWDQRDPHNWPPGTDALGKVQCSPGRCRGEPAPVEWTTSHGPPSSIESLRSNTLMCSPAERVRILRSRETSYVTRPSGCPFFVTTASKTREPSHLAVTTYPCVCGYSLPSACNVFVVLSS